MKIFLKRLLIIIICIMCLPKYGYAQSVSPFAEVKSYTLLADTESVDDLSWYDSSILVTQSRQFAIQGGSALNINMDSVGDNKGLVIPFKESQMLAQADAICFHISVPHSDQGDGILLKTFLEYDGVQLSPKNKSTVYLQNDGDVIWQSQTYNGAVGVKSGFSGFIKIPLQNALQINYTAIGETAIRLEMINRIYMVISGFGGEKGGVYLDAFNAISNDDGKTVPNNSFLVGDLDEDSNINSSDLVLLRRLLLDHKQSELFRADTDGSGETNVKDLVHMKKYNQLPGSVTMSGLPENSHIDLEPLTGDRSREMLKNPDRGFRLETYYTLKNEVAYPNSGQSAFTFFDNMILDYADDSPQLSQAFFYITEYYNKDLDEIAFNKLDKYFRYIRAKKLRLLIRFVYQWDEADRVSGPTADQVKRHIKQLAPIIERNKDVIHCWQAGFLGNWGEWHNLIVPMTNEDKGDILKLLVDNSPENLFIQTRMVEYRDTVTDSAPQKKFIGYHDDYLTGFPNDWSCGLTPETSDYQRMIDQSEKLLVDGEMPWGNDTQMGENFDGLDMAEYLSKRHFTSMSLVHNYREGGVFSISNWKTQTITQSTLSSRGLIAAPGWFEKSDGSAATKTIFDYIQQHLGYYLVASDLDVSTSGRTVNASVTIKNYGFAAPLAMKAPELVLIDENGKVMENRTGENVYSYQPGKPVRLSACFSHTDVKTSYSVGIRFVNSAGVPAKIGNNTEFVNGINVIYSFR